MLKHRYSDFVVSEIALDGAVCQVTSIEAEKVVIIDAADLQVVNASLEANLVQVLSDTFSIEALKQGMAQLLDGTVLQFVVAGSLEMDRAQRTAVHKYVN